MNDFDRIYGFSLVVSNLLSSVILLTSMSKYTLHSNNTHPWNNKIKPQME